MQTRKTRPRASYAPVAKKEVEQLNTTYYELIYDPERVRGLGNQPRRYLRDVGEIDSPQGVGISELKGQWIIPGRNRIDVKEWEYIKEDSEVQEFVRKNVYHLIVPISNENGTLQDFQESDALEIINYTYDNEALDVELLQEKRTEILKAIKAQIKKNLEQNTNSNMSLATRG